MDGLRSSNSNFPSTALSRSQICAFLNLNSQRILFIFGTLRGTYPKDDPSSDALRIIVTLLDLLILQKFQIVQVLQVNPKIVTRGTLPNSWRFCHATSSKWLSKSNLGRLCRFIIILVSTHIRSMPSVCYGDSGFTNHSEWLRVGWLKPSSFRRMHPRDSCVTMTLRGVQGLRIILDLDALAQDVYSTF